MTRKKVAAKPAKARPKRRSSAHSKSALLEPMGLELFGVLRRGLTQYGISPGTQEQLFAQSQRNAPIVRSSTRLLAQFRGLADLIATWHGEVPWLDAGGNPKVLKIHGRGVTFEKLGRQFLPGTPLAEVVEFACRTANVGTLPGNRIALYGDIMVNMSRNPEAVLAQTIAHLTQIFGTGIYNVARPDIANTRGRLERIVTLKLAPKDFDKFQGAARPQVHDLCDRVERLLRSCAKSSRKTRQQLKPAGMGIYLYYDDEAVQPRGKPKKSTR
jgi:hypothetical protein